ncbi:hypothetical protein [Gellertiella hungarica]|uniref:Uncharacterized protein n=1 Tax=Gellertiella hungarica TaxID=1572859 RepID=A0A7W6NKU9_9HYPH|nr:hypothetical protein [Gellertiella hungarica]MBB4064780.1 hypothetical protein [Gellertiella hungarica]
MPDKITMISVCWMTLMGAMFAAMLTLADSDPAAIHHTTSRVVTAHS